MSFIKHHEHLVESGVPDDEAYDLAFPFEPHPTRCDWCLFKNECRGLQEQGEKDRKQLEEFRQSLRTR
jgi:hypothetical protein